MPSPSPALQTGKDTHDHDNAGVEVVTADVVEALRGLLAWADRVHDEEDTSRLLDHLERHDALDRAREVLAARPAAPAGLDVERLARWLHEARVGCSTDVCDPTPALYVGVSRTMHETDARDILAAIRDATHGRAGVSDQTPAAQTSEPQTEAGRRLLALDDFETACLDGEAMSAIILAIEAEAQRLTVERLTPWLIHGLDASGHQCGFYTAESCDCGLRAALAREETGE